MLNPAEELEGAVKRLYANIAKMQALSNSFGEQLAFLGELGNRDPVVACEVIYGLNRIFSKRIIFEREMQEQQALLIEESLKKAETRESRDEHR